MRQIQPPFYNNLKDIADSMGIALYQRFPMNEASLFLRYPMPDLEDLFESGEIEYIQISKSEVQPFDCQLNSISGNFSAKF